MAQVKNCLNPHCKKNVPTYKRSGNKSGIKGYCSMDCYCYFPPKMVEIVHKYTGFPHNRVGMKRIILLEYKEGKSRLDTAYRIGVTWHTLARFETKLFGRLLKSRR